MTTADIIQLSILLVLTGTLAVGVWQVRLQNRLRQAQLLRDRFEMYWKLYDPLPADATEWMELVPSDYMPPEVFEEHYAGHPERMRKYAGLAQAYEYLAFEYTMRRYEIDPLGADWTENWVRDLVDEPEFVQVHEHYRAYYPAFAEHIDELMSEPAS